MRYPKKKYSSFASPTNLYIGSLIGAHFKRHGIRISELAARMGRSHSVVSRFQRTRAMHTSMLEELCYELEYNFFADIASRLPAAFASNVPPPAADAAKDAEIARLEAELAQARQERDQAKSERELLMTVITRLKA